MEGHRSGFPAVAFLIRSGLFAFIGMLPDSRARRASLKGGRQGGELFVHRIIGSLNDGEVLFIIIDRLT
jgi:hypothetical protein